MDDCISFNIGKMEISADQINLLFNEHRKLCHKNGQFIFEFGTMNGQNEIKLMGHSIRPQHNLKDYEFLMDTYVNGEKISQTQIDSAQLVELFTKETNSQLIQKTKNLSNKMNIKSHNSFQTQPKKYKNPPSVNYSEKQPKNQFKGQDLNQSHRQFTSQSKKQPKNQFKGQDLNQSHRQTTSQSKKQPKNQLRKPSKAQQETKQKFKPGKKQGYVINPATGAQIKIGGPKYKELCNTGNYIC